MNLMKMSLIQANSLTIDELASSRIRDPALASVFIEFESPAGYRYEAVHIRWHPNGPYILLCGLDKDRDDFKAVENVVSETASGEARNDISDRSSDICDVIDIPFRVEFAHEKIAYLAGEYARQGFRNVRITKALYNLDDPKSAAELLGIPVDRVQTLI